MVKENSDIYQKRIQKVQEFLRKENGVALVTGNLPIKKTEDQVYRFRNSNLFFLTGTIDQDLGVLITKDEVFLFRWKKVNPIWGTCLENEKALATKLGAKLIDESKIWDQISKCKLFFGDRLSSWSGKFIQKILDSQITSLREKPIRVASVEEILIPLREVKSEYEIKIMIEAAKKATEIFKSFKNLVRPGLSEIEIRNILYSQIYVNHCHPSFDAIVAAGKNAAILHHTPTHKRWEKNEPLLVDFGIYYNDYAIDVTRILFIKPSSRVREIYEIVKSVNELISLSLNPEKTYNDILNETKQLLGKELKKIIKSFDIGEVFPHGWGHSIGLDVHDPSSFGLNKNSRIKNGMVVTVEPGLYFRNKQIGEAFGIRVEDCVVINKKKNLVLTAGIPKEFKDMII